MNLFAEIDVAHRALVGLVRQPDHKKDVELSAAMVECGSHQLNNFLIGAGEFSILAADIFVRAFQRNLQAVLADGALHFFKEIVVRAPEQLEDQFVGGAKSADSLQKFIDILCSALANIANHKDGRATEALDAFDVLHELCRRAHGGLGACAVERVGAARSTAESAILRASAHGEQRAERIAEPALIGQRIQQAVILKYRSHRVAIVGNVDVVEIRGRRADGIHKHFSIALPGQVGHRGKIHGSRLDLIDQRQHGTFGGVAAHDEIDAIVLHQFAMVIGGGETAENDGHVRMIFLHQLGNLDASLGMWQPVQRNAESSRL